MATPVGSFVPLTSDPLKDGLIQGGIWQFSGAQTLTYSLHSETTSTWTDERQDALAAILSSWSDVANISFSQIDGGDDYRQSPADMAFTFGGFGYGVLAEAFFPDPAFADEVLPYIDETRTSYPKPEGDITIYERDTAFLYLDPGGFGYAVILHEIGHALGLKHPHDDGGSGRPELPSQYDSGYDTVMSYNDPQIEDFGSITVESRGFQATPMPLDILAIQHLYGANMSHNAGSDIYYLTADGVIKTIWDAGGTDEINASGMTQGITLSLVEGSLTRHGIYSATAIAYNVVIENATGTSFADRITCNAANNIIDGGAGADTLAGGAGDDTYYIDNIGDRITENAAAGTDLVISAATHTLGANVEDLFLTGAGNVSGTGNTLANALTGNSGNNTLNGAAGADTMTGGAGDDTYYVDNEDDEVIESSSEGTDRVFASVSFMLEDDLEHLTLTGTAHSSATGNAQINILTGNGGNNTLDGGAGADTMNGGAGNDTYVLDNAGDIVIDSGGIDTMVTSVSHILATGRERLVLPGLDDINGTGNSAVNIITGNSGNNTLSGAGGNDTTIGGDGDDTHIVAAAGDVVTELENEGTDTVHSIVTYVLRDHVENLVLAGTSGIHGTGNALDNIITGNNGVNTLNGGAGADTLTGGLGKDTYIVDDADDVVTETSALLTEIDTVKSAVSFELGDYLENLVLTAAGAGTGNALKNTITGSTGADTLDGGIGADKMLGGAGNDTYYIDNLLDVVTETSSGGIDTIFSSVNKVLASNFERLTLLDGAVIGTGNSLANVITGNGAGNTLNGSGGNDTLDGGAGADTLIGGAGIDIFLFTPSGLDLTFDTIMDFSRSQGDILDISDLLFGFDPLFITDFVQLATSGTDTVFSVDRDGTGGGYSLAQIGLLKNVTGLTDEAALVTSGHLLVA